jgi:alkylhydroperoxidase/carboxymuconolactone decarboxylase family protein YurZ
MAAEINGTPENNEKEEELKTAIKMFEEFVATAMGPGALDQKTKQLVTLAAALGAG